jgi:hypothetical protein
VDELLTKEPLLKLVGSGAAVAAEVERLRENDFHDEYEDARCEASRDGTWEMRARAMVHAADSGVPAATNIFRRRVEATAAQMVKA